jgi:hypothetical protein
MDSTQPLQVGDGTTSVTVLAGELLREAEKLIQLRIHPMVIIDGWRRATAVARAALEASSLDHGADPVAFREDLLNIARTTLSSKLLTHEKDQFAQLAVDAVMRIKSTLNLEQIQIIKRSGGSLKARKISSPEPHASPPRFPFGSCRCVLASLPFRPPPRNASAPPRRVPSPSAVGVMNLKELASFPVLSTMTSTQPKRRATS